MIAPVTVPFAFRLLGFSAAFLLSRRSHKSAVLCSPPFRFASERDHISAALWLSPSHTFTRTEERESRCLRNPRSPANPARGVRRLGFWGAILRLLAEPVSVFLLVIVGTRGTRPRLLPVDRLRNPSGDRSWDCTTNTVLHRLWFTTSSNALCRLVRMEDPMPSAWDPPLDTV